jgi:hypothetical protein
MFSLAEQTRFTFAEAPSFGGYPEMAAAIDGKLSWPPLVPPPKGIENPGFGRGQQSQRPVSRCETQSAYTPGAENAEYGQGHRYE